MPHSWAVSSKPVAVPCAFLGTDPAAMSGWRAIRPDMTSLDRRKLGVDYVVVNQVEKAPTEN
jgi:hypothetical protein